MRDSPQSVTGECLRVTPSLVLKHVFDSLARKDYGEEFNLELNLLRDVHTLIRE